MTLADVATAARFADLAGLLESCEVDGFRADFVSFGFYRPEYWRNYWHSHSFHEVCLAYAGEGRFSIGSTANEVGPGSVFLARPGDVHEIESSQATPLGIAFWGFRFRPVSTGSGAAGSGAAGSGRAAGPEAAVTGWWAGLTRADGPVVSARVGALPSVVSVLAAEAAQPVSGYSALLNALGGSLVLETARAFALEEDLAVEPIVRDRGPVVVDAMRRHLMDNLSRPVTVREVAAAVHLSERHAERLFRQQTGSSLMSTLRRMRLELAAQLLLDPGLSITEVARSCGYSDVRPFSTAFRRQYGRTPGEHRRRGGTDFY